MKRLPAFLIVMSFSADPTAASACSPLLTEPSLARETARQISLGTITRSQLAEKIIEDTGRITLRSGSAYRFPEREMLILETWVREDPNNAEVVLEALRIVADETVRPETRREMLAASEELRARLKARARPELPPAGAWYVHDSRISVDRPPTSDERKRLAHIVFEEKLNYFLDRELPTEDRKDYVREGFRAWLAQDCKTFLGGRLFDACEDLGLFTWRYSALKLALRGLANFNGDLSVLNPYFDQDQALLDRAVALPIGIGCDDIPEKMGLLARWIARRPTRWQVWAALER